MAESSTGWKPNQRKRKITGLKNPSSASAPEISMGEEALKSAYQDWGLEAKAGVSVADFDYSVENFFAEMRKLSALCGATGEESFEASEVQRFSSMITFLKEWRQYYYRPKSINFSYETGSTELDDVTKGISLSQFSSAVVPKLPDKATMDREWRQYYYRPKSINFSYETGSTELDDVTKGISLSQFSSAVVPKLPDKATMDSNDFILNAGGPIWALDWCPRTPEKSDCNINCEYLAVAAHPPGSTYHKIGAPLVGRGVIQIWCFLSANDEAEFLPPRPVRRGRPTKKSAKEVLPDINSEKEFLQLSLVNPRKGPVSGICGNVPSLKRPRGRPRKPLPIVISLGGKEESPACNINSIPSVIEEILPLNVDFGEVPSVTPGAVDLSCKAKSSVALRRRKRAKKADPCRHESLPASCVELEGNESAIVTTSRGLILESVNVKSPTVDVAIVALGLPASSPLNVTGKSSVLKRRGRPRKRPISSGNDVSTSCFIFEDDASALSTSGGHGEDKLAFDTSRGVGLRSANVKDLSVGAVVDASRLTAAAPLNGTGESSGPKHREGPGNIQIPNEHEAITPGSKCGDDVSAQVTSGGLVHLGNIQIPNEHEAPTPGSKCGDDVSAQVTSGGLVDPISKGLSIGLNDVPLALPAFAYSSGKQKSVEKKRRGRPRKKSTPSTKECDPAGVELGEDASSLPMSRLKSSGLLNLSMNSINADLEEFALPRVVLCLAHNGKVAWDVKWRPPNASDSGSKHHLGYLAVLLGNGFLEVWEVPLPSMVKILYGSTCYESTDPRFLKLEPVFRCSKVKCGDRASIPLTTEWSPSAPHDLLLAGCHDGTVAIWKFSTHYSSQDTKPLLCFVADSVPIRALAWAPDESDAAAANIIVTAGHESLKFWDIRDPYHPLWELNPPVQRVVLSLDWVKDQRCIILSLEDGNLKTISLLNAACDVPVTGKPFVGTKQNLLHGYPCSTFAIWSVQVSRKTGQVAYCSADGSVFRFQLTAKSVDKDPRRNREPHFLCGSLKEEGQTLMIHTPLPNTPLPDVPFSTKRSSADCRDAPPRNLRDCLSDAYPRFPALCQGGDEGKMEPERKLEVFPPKVVAMHRVRWNMNEGSERWLCYGGAAGIIRCQKIPIGL